TVGDDRTTLSGGNPMYFPSTGNAVNIYAIHGNIAETSFANFWNTSITHSVLQDQQSSVSEAGKGYAGSDLVYCKLGNVPRKKDAVNLQFKHLLSKIEVVLVQGNGAPGIDKVEILNTKLDAVFTPSKTADWAVSASGDNNPITIDKGTTPKTDAEDDNKDNDVLNEAIIVPQTLQGGTQFIRITTNKGGQLFYSLPTEGRRFEAGKKYRYTITANLTGLDVTATIGDWKPTEDTSDDAEME
ncbi:fimbrillin family protein, partial [Bacteroides rodentium]